MLNVAENLKRMRIDSGTEKKQLATFFNITEGTYSRWENGTRVPDLFNLVRLSEYFGCTLEDLVLDHSDDNLVNRDLVLSYRDIADKGYNGSLAHGLIKEVLLRSTYENVPVVSHDKKIKFVYKEDVKKLLEELLTELI